MLLRNATSQGLIMVDSRQKGARAETVVKDELKQLTGLKWERTPLSGALDAKHVLKGDLYSPGNNLAYCVEVKHYAEDHFNSSIFSSVNPQLTQWWTQTVREAEQIGKKPLLIFKHDRSKIFCAFSEFPNSSQLTYAYIHRPPHEFYVAKLQDWIKYEGINFLA